jgi:hypothetical protein
MRRKILAADPAVRRQRIERQIKALRAACRNKSAPLHRGWMGNVVGFQPFPSGAAHSQSTELPESNLIRDSIVILVTAPAEWTAHS